MASGSNRDGRELELEREIEGYREAATAALDQLQWVINYLHRIRKDAIADALEHNRARIIEQGRPDH